MDHEAIGAIYNLQSVIGEGSTGSVWRAIHRATGDVVAIKAIPLPDDENLTQGAIKDLRREVFVHSNLLHGGVCALREVYASPRCWYLITECCEGGDLLSQVMKRKYTEGEARTLVVQLCEALAYLHAQGITHRDVKCENIFLRKAGARCTGVVLGDFGLARWQTSGMSDVCGSVLYVAPEVVACHDNSHPPDLPCSTSCPGDGRRGHAMHHSDRGPQPLHPYKTYGSACDMWSLGVLLYIVLTGSPPFDGKSAKAVVDRIRAYVASPPDLMDDPRLAHVSPELRGLVSLLLSPDPNARPTPDEVCQAAEAARQAAAHDGRCADCERAGHLEGAGCTCCSSGRAAAGGHARGAGGAAAGGPRGDLAAASSSSTRTGLRGLHESSPYVTPASRSSAMHMAGAAPGATPPARAPIDHMQTRIRERLEFEAAADLGLRPGGSREMLAQQAG